MDLFILRHGKAEPAGRGTDDAARRLTKKGQEEIAAIAAYLASEDYLFDLIASSPLVRARETAGIVATVLGEPDRLVTWECLIPGGDPDTVCREVSAFPEDHRLLLVGHEPLLSALVGRIIGGGDGAAVAMSKGSLAKIRNFSFAERPAGELHWLITPKHTCRINR